MTEMRVKVIGAGRIGAPVLDFLRNSARWHLASCLLRKSKPLPEATTDAESFFAETAELVVEVAGPDALRLHGERVLMSADLWTTSAAALAEAPLRNRLEAVGLASGHRLRVLGGALGGLDGVATAATDPDARLHVTATRPGMVGEAGRVFAGSLAEAARLFPHEINFAVAAALAGPGVERTSIELNDSGPGGAHVLSLLAQSRSGSFRAEHRLDATQGGLHPVAAAIIAALTQAGRVVQAG
jgi:aspartate dehydrogenase